MLLGEITRADNRMNPIHLRSYPADIQIRIPDHILLLVESALSDCSCWKSQFPSLESVWPPESRPICRAPATTAASSVSSRLAPPSDLLGPSYSSESIGRQRGEATLSGVQRRTV